MKYALIWIGIGFLLGFALRECTDEPCPEYRDETNIKSKRDTIAADTAIKKSQIKPKGTKIPAHAVPHGITHGEITDSSAMDIYAYRDSVVNEEIAIYVTDTVCGQILSKEIAYRLKVPLRIIDSVFVTKTRIVDRPVPQRGVFIGLEVGLSTLRKFRIAPEIEYLTKTGYAYSYNYDVLNNLHSVGIKRKLTFK